VALDICALIVLQDTGDLRKSGTTCPSEPLRPKREAGLVRREPHKAINSRLECFHRQEATNLARELADLTEEEVVGFTSTDELG